MNQPWWALAVVAVVGAGIGVGSAALLGSDGEPSRAAAGPVTTPDPTTAPTATDAPPTDAPASGTDTTTATAPTATTTMATTTTTEAPQPPAEDVAIVVANGAATNGIAAAAADLLRSAGWPDVQLANGVDVFGGTVVYVADGFEPTAERIVADLQAANPEFATPTFIVPLADLPGLVPPRPGAAIVVYLGRDQIGLR
jgi:hypothetical protein